MLLAEQSFCVMQLSVNLCHIECIMGPLLRTLINFSMNKYLHLQ